MRARGRTAGARKGLKRELGKRDDLVCPASGCCGVQPCRHHQPPPVQPSCPVPSRGKHVSERSARPAPGAGFKSSFLITAELIGSNEREVVASDRGLSWGDGTRMIATLC